MNKPENLFYTRDHEWVSGTKGEVSVGISAFALEQLGDIVHVELPREGQTFKQGEAFGTVESTKTVSDLYMPASGKIVAVNSALLKKPEAIAEDPYNQGWIVKVQLDADAQSAELMQHGSYQAYLKEAH